MVLREPLIPTGQVVRHTQPARFFIRPLWQAVAQPFQAVRSLAKTKTGMVQVNFTNLWDDLINRPVGDLSNRPTKYQAQFAAL